MSTIYVVVEQFGERYDDWQVVSAHSSESLADKGVAELEKIFEDECGETLQEAHDEGRENYHYIWWEALELDNGED